MADLKLKVCHVNMHGTTGESPEQFIVASLLPPFGNNCCRKFYTTDPWNTTAPEDKHIEVRDWRRRFYKEVCSGMLCLSEKLGQRMHASLCSACTCCGDPPAQTICCNTVSYVALVIMPCTLCCC
jgi:hypothetical protein